MKVRGFPIARGRSSYRAGDRRFFGNVAEVSQDSSRRFAIVESLPIDGRRPDWEAPMKRLLLTATALIGFAGISAANAADLALKAPPPPPVVDEWTGWYAGLNLGGSWGRSSTTYTGALIAPFTTSQNMDGVLGGGQVGYNWQFNKSWVIGLEADIQGTGQRGTANLPTIFVPPILGILALGLPGTTSVGTLTQKLPWFGTVRARLGAEPSSNWLLYVTGGLAYGEIRSTLSTNAVTTTGVATATSAGANNDRAGWTVGAGSEWMFAKQWSAKVEYLYMDYGHISDGFLGTGSYATVAINSHVTDNVVRAGVNYHFH
jgi:outer membrane immunogenic protein